MKERTFIEQGMKKIQLEQYLQKNLNKAGFTGLHMVKTPLVTRIVLVVARPGLAIGKGGQNIRMLTEEISKKFGIDNPQIEIQDIKNPALDSKATVDKMVELIERGFNWKSVVFRTTREITEAGAQGMELVLKGKLSGKGGRKRKHRAVQGYMKKVGNQVNLVDTAKASAYPKAGAIGVKLSIIRPEVEFPDKKDLGKELREKEKASEEKEAEEKKTEKEVQEKEGKTGEKEKNEKGPKQGPKPEAKAQGKKAEEKGPKPKTGEKQEVKKEKEKKSEKGQAKEKKAKAEKKPGEKKKEGKKEKKPSEEKAKKPAEKGKEKN